MFEFPPKWFMWRHFRQWRKNSDFAAHFWRNSGAANRYGFVYYSNFQPTFKDGKIKSTVFTRPHAMKHHKIMGPMLGKGNHNFWYLSTLKSNIFSTRKLRVFWLILWYIYTGGSSGGNPAMPPPPKALEGGAIMSFAPPPPKLPETFFRKWSWVHSKK